MAASWYHQRRRPAPRRETLATTDAQPKTAVSTRYQPSWTQLRARMELSDALQVAWVDTIGFYVDEEELQIEPTNSAVPIQFEVSVTVQQPKTFCRPAGQMIDAQVIALNRTVPAMPMAAPKTAAANLPMLRLEQLNMYRLAGAAR